MCVHKDWSLKKDTTGMTAATNEACIWWLHENGYLMLLIIANNNVIVNCYLLKGIFLVGIWI